MSAAVDCSRLTGGEPAIRHLLPIWLIFLDGRRPVPGEELVEVAQLDVGDAAEDIGEPGLWIDTVHFCGDDAAIAQRPRKPAGAWTARAKIYAPPCQ